MSFNWKEFLKLAQLLKEDKDIKCNKEAAYRSAVSRAYFSAFCFARNYAQANLDYQPLFNADDHSHIREHYRIYNMDEIARLLDHLRGWRNECDYFDEINNREGTLDVLVNTALSRAGRLFTLLEKNKSPA